mmetsp:Transcript_22580/g.57375  ORF Transcript_22580/g.57375 Transcript_22580/m.57375 type:complete len:207 (-) Transcript_22580:887-1507(-)
MPASASSEPGCTSVSCCWKQWPDVQSQNHMLPLSPPVTMTPSWLTAMALTIARCCDSMLCRKSPSGSANFLMLSADADANACSSGCSAMARTLFLWYVSVDSVLAVRRSHILMVESCEPVMTCGSVGCDRMEHTVWSWPLSTWICVLVRMSHTRHTLSRPPVNSTSSLGCSAMEYTPDRCPWYERMTLFCSRSQHLTVLSRPHENM